MLTNSGGLDARLFLDSGFFNFRVVLDIDTPFCFILGGRGTGKTYGAFSTFLQQEPGTWCMIRRTKAEIDMLAEDAFNPFASYNISNNTSYHVEKTKTYSYVSNNDGDMIAPILALSSVSTMRGFGGDKIKYAFFDEFIPQSDARKIKNEDEGILNAYETINRNREMAGKAPLKMILATNSNNIASPILLSFDIISDIREMRKKGESIRILVDRGITIIDLTGSPVSKQKENTALYKAVSKQSNFYQMSIENDFELFSNSAYKKLNLGRMRPLVTVGKVTIYECPDGGYYASTRKSGNCPHYGTSEMELLKFFGNYSFLRRAHLRNFITFEDEKTEILFDKAFRG